MKISNIDKNLEVRTSIDEKNLKFFDVTKKPFKLHGINPPDEFDDVYYRLPPYLAGQVNEGVKGLAKNTAGGRIRFRTNSNFVAIYAVTPNIGAMPHMANCGKNGFDLYVTAENSIEERYFGSFMPPATADYEKYESILYFPTSEMRTVTINMPLYNNVAEVYVGLNKDSEIKEADDYKHSIPVVFYGSSITQGGCASRPGTSYQGFLSRTCKCDYINLGFSGSAKGEPIMAEYISNLNMSAFVLDYDHNAPDPEHLRKTHENFFKIIRKAQPELPVIIITKPKLYLGEVDKERWNIIKSTYDKAVKSGDKNVYFIDGSKFYEDCPYDDMTVDSVHPTDLGFYFMAKHIEPVLKKILDK